MARPLRVQFPGATYHVMSRGFEKGAIFVVDDDRRRFLSELDEVAERLGWSLWAYCLMGNHYHLLLQTCEPNLARGMRDLNGRYSQAFNHRHDRVGHLFQGRYKALVVDDEVYLHQVARYIVLNPVRGGLCARPEEWSWTSYRATCGDSPGPLCLRADEALAVFDRDRAVARSAYMAFVEAGLNQPDPARLVRNQLFVGDDTFVARAAAWASTQSEEIPKRQRRATRRLAEFSQMHERRNAAIAAAHASGLYTLSEIGAHFGLHYASVSKIVRTERTMLRSKT